METMKPLTIHLGVKSDPVEYRYSYEWLFRLMANEGVHHLQLGSFFELYQLDDDYFRALRQTASEYGVAISSVFTSHRELGGFFRDDPYWEKVARRNYERLIEVAALLGAKHAGSSMGAVLRDQMQLKEHGLARFLAHIKDLMLYAQGYGLEYLTIEPMSCLAEPPTLPGEIVQVAEELMAHHRSTPGTVPVGYCADISHGYADENEQVRHGNMELFEVTLPYLVEFHVKNTDHIFNATFGFSEAERARGIVDLAALRDLLYNNAGVLPVDELVGYLELGGPKFGRDYTDKRLEESLRGSLQYMRDVFS